MVLGSGENLCQTDNDCQGAGQGLTLEELCKNQKTKFNIILFLNMNKKIILVIFAILLILALIIAYNKKRANDGPKEENKESVDIKILKQGSGKGAEVGDSVTVHYVGTLENGTKFDSSIDRGEPFQFTLGENMVIQGWEYGVLGMKVGEKRRLTILPEFAYGPRGVGEMIPPNSTLIFEIDLLKIN